MAFSSVIFIFAFLPLSLLCYNLLGRNNNITTKNVLLLILSLIFYAWCGIGYLALLMVLLVVNYWFSTHVSGNKKWLVMGIAVDLIVLAFFKYLNFCVDSVAAIVSMLTGQEAVFTVARIPLPLGISFIAFQVISFLVDRYHNKIEEQPTFVEFALYITMFPQLIQGPIVRYSQVGTALKERTVQREDLHAGVQRFILGLAKKVFLANTVATVANQAFSSVQLPIGFAWLGIICYAMEIYFDFSGYSDMAIGLCRMFGFHILENFNFPYLATSIQDFWRRWHISLSSWFRDYVYIPLGGNRNGVAKTYRNLIIVFFLTGLWHGANWTFICWGLFHGAFMLLERVGFGRVLKKLPIVVQRLYSLVVVLIGWVFFRANDVAQAGRYIASMFFPMTNNYADISMMQLLDGEFVILLVISILVALKIPQQVYGRFADRIPQPVKDAVLVLLFLVSLAFVAGSDFSPSIYEKF